MSTASDLAQPLVRMALFIFTNIHGIIPNVRFRPKADIRRSPYSQRPPGFISTIKLWIGVRPRFSTECVIGGFQ